MIGIELEVLSVKRSGKVEIGKFARTTVGTPHRRLRHVQFGSGIAACRQQAWEPPEDGWQSQYAYRRTHEQVNDNLAYFDVVRYYPSDLGSRGKIMRGRGDVSSRRG